MTTKLNEKTNEGCSIIRKMKHLDFGVISNRNRDRDKDSECSALNPPFENNSVFTF